MESEPFGAINDKISRMKNVINLGSGDPAFNTPPHIIDAAYDALKEGLTRYAPTSGLPGLREAISNYYQKFDVNVNPENEIIVTPGSQQALFLTLISILDPGDEILIPNPSYTVYSPIIRYLKGKPVQFDLDMNNGFHVDPDSLRNAVTPKTKGVIICTPNNPTGTVFNMNDLETIADVTIENDLVTISDEIYSEFIWSKNKHRSIASLNGMKDRSVVIVSFSKTFAMTGWRLGYLIANKELVDLMLQLQGNMILCSASFIQKAGIAALEGTWEPVYEMVKEYKRRIDYVVKRLNDIDGINCDPPEGAFYVWADISKLTNSCLDFCDDLIDEKGVVTLAGTHFGSNGEGYMRLALVNSLEVIAEGINRIESFIKERSK